MDNVTAADQLTQFSQELGMYDEFGLDRSALADRVANKLLEVASMDDLESAYYEMQKEWAETLATVQLEQVARDLGIEI